tara:strand:- start:6186 stop:6872 length:687 start_codon:yes stop_codon:yes gene_type:complete
MKKSRIVEIIQEEIQSVLNERPLDEMAKIKDDLKTAIEKVIADNPDLEGLALKKAIRADANVEDATMGDTIYDNQLNKFIALTRGERELSRRGRKPGTLNAPADPNAPEKAPKAPKAPKAKKTKSDDEDTTQVSKLAGTVTTAKGVELSDKDKSKIAKKVSKAQTPGEAEYSKQGDSLAQAKDDLVSHMKDMKAKAIEYKAAEGDAKETLKDELKDMTAEKKRLEAAL